MKSNNKYNWDKLFADWEAKPGENSMYKGQESILVKGKNEIAYSTFNYLNAQGEFSYLNDLPFEARQALGDYIMERVATKQENIALEKIRVLGVIK